jgi:predicted ATPase
MRLLRLELTNFLSYREAALDLTNLNALVGPNASGKSNLVAALKLLGDLPTYGLQTAILRRGGFDQLRHRSRGRPYDPSIAIEFELGPGQTRSRYELHFAAVAGGRYAVKLEKAHIYIDDEEYSFTHRRGQLETSGDGFGLGDSHRPSELIEVPEGQSALPAAIPWGAYYLWNLLNSIQIVEINPARVRDLQEPTPGHTFEPDGSNTASVFESLAREGRRQLFDELAAVVPSLTSVEVRRFSNKMTLQFGQTADGKRREFLAAQMSDGTLRAFGIILSLYQARRPVLLVIEEPEVAIHLGALRTLVDILAAHSDEAQILLTTHSADIIDALEIDALRVVWAEQGVSHVAPVADHTRETIRSGLITPGELLRSDALDPLLV